MGRTTHEIRLPRHSLRYAALRLPVHRTRDKARAKRSRLTYGANPDGTYSTSVLGVLNGWFGVYITVLPCQICDRADLDAIAKRDKTEGPQ